MKNIFSMFGAVFSMLFGVCVNAQVITFPTHTQMNVFEFPYGTETFHNVDIGIKWHKEPTTNWGYYAMYSFAFETNTIAYTGLQKDSWDGKKAIFSVWDVGNEQTALPTGLDTCVRFGHEGNGTMCLTKLDWKAGVDYRISIRRHMDAFDTGFDRWTANLVNTATDEQQHIGTIKVRNSAGLRGYGNIIPHRQGVVLEYYSGANGTDCSAAPYFGVTWNGPFGNDGMKVASNANNIYRTGIGTYCDNRVNTSSTGPHIISMETGGAIATRTPENSRIWGRYDGSLYNSYNCLFEYAERTYPNEFPGNTSGGQARLSKSVRGYYMRDYFTVGSGNSIVVDTLNNRLLIGSFDGSIVDIGNVNEWINNAGCR